MKNSSELTPGTGENNKALVSSPFFKQAWFTNNFIKVLFKSISSKINKELNYPSMNSQIIEFPPFLYGSITANQRNFLLHFAIVKEALLSKHSLNISKPKSRPLERASTGKIDYFDVNVKKDDESVSHACQITVTRASVALTFFN